MHCGSDEKKSLNTRGCMFVKIFIFPIVVRVETISRFVTFQEINGSTISVLIFHLTIVIKAVLSLVTTKI